MSTLLQLRTNVFTKLAESSGATFSEDEINQYIQREYEYLQTIISASNEDYFAKVVTGPSSGSEKFGLPSDFLKMLLVEVKDNDTWFEAPYVPIRMRERYKTGLGSHLYLANGRVYTIIDRCCIILPTMAQSVTDNIRLTYVPILPALGQDIDNPLLPELYHELLEIGAVNRARQAIKEPPIDLQHYTTVLDSMQNTLTPKVRKQPRQVRMVRGPY